MCLSRYAINSMKDIELHGADIHDFHYFCVFLVYKNTDYAKTEHWERIYLISN